MVLNSFNELLRAFSTAIMIRDVIHFAIKKSFFEKCDNNFVVRFKSFWINFVFKQEMIY